MIDTFLKVIVSELGPTGLLIIGVYYVLGQHLKKISRCIEQINHNTTKLTEIVERCTDRICDKIESNH